MSTFLFKFHISRFCGSTILNVWFSSKFDFRKLSTVLIGCFLMELTFFSQISPYFFSETWLIIESALSKRNIFRQSWSKDFGTLQWYTTGSILEFDILNWNLISSKEFRNASCLWVPKPLKAEDLWKFGNIRKISNLAGDSLVPSLPCRS